MYSYNKVREKKIFFKLLEISKKFSDMLIEKDPHVSGPSQFKPVLFQGWLFGPTVWSFLSPQDTVDLAFSLYPNAQRTAWHTVGAMWVWSN